MSYERKRQGRRRHRRHRRREEPEPPEELELDDDLLGSDEQRLRQAHRRADRKTRLAGDALKFGVITLLLLIFVFPIGLIVLFCWGFPLFRRYYRLEVEPRVREKFIEREVRSQVHATLSQERRNLEGQHARSMEQLSASIAHEIRNPITAAKSLVQQMGEDMGARENVEYAKVALDELGRVERSVSHLLRFARDEEMHVASVRMADVIESALETFRERAERSGVRIEKQLDCEGALFGDAEQLRRVVINLVGNAVDVLDESNTPDPVVDVQMGENLAGSEVWIRIRDNGPGIDDEARERIFSPLYTSKDQGTGLGLSITRKLVDAHGGSIELESEPGAGAEFLITLPKGQSHGEVKS
jgi:signal transduction histidine kinase